MREGANMKPLKQVADELGVKESTLINEHKRGELPLVTIGTLKFVEDEDMIKWIRSKRVLKPSKRQITPEHRAKIQAAQAARKAANAARKAANAA